MSVNLSAMDVAQYVIDKCIHDDRPISNLQLQKILYFCQEEWLKSTSTPLFEDDFQAWQYGPVIPGVYKVFSIWGGNRITRNPIEGGQGIPNDQRAVIDGVVEVKRERKPWQLVSETHVPGSPWHTVYNGGSGDGGLISKSAIQNYACQYGL